MKKFLFFLILLIITAGVVGWFGWVRIPENSSGVFFSQLTGYDEKLLETGKFHWKWQKLIPKTTKLYIINTAPHTVEFLIIGTLPSSKVYSEIMPGNPDFSYNASITAVYTIDEASIIESIKSNAAEQDAPSITADSFYTQTDIELEIILANHINSVIAKNLVSYTGKEEFEKMLFNQEVLKNTVSSEMPKINLSSIKAGSRAIPDINLYKAAISVYDEIASDRKKQVLESEINSASIQAELDKKLEALEKYGELLTKYPILIEYLKINPQYDILSAGAGRQ